MDSVFKTNISSVPGSSSSLPLVLASFISMPLHRRTMDAESFLSWGRNCQLSWNDLSWNDHPPATFVLFATDDLPRGCPHVVLADGCCAATRGPDARRC